MDISPKKQNQMLKASLENARAQNQHMRNQVHEVLKLLRMCNKNTYIRKSITILESLFK